ncbi:hypothetical protein [Fulvivirga sp.]|uniref:hypothetical protein n=1 Tax=Fulvivirga sp. TaxID=1931237 RepID=UPI0032EAD18C
MTSSDKLKQIAELLGKKVKKSNVVGSGLTFDLKDYKGFKIKFYSYPLTIKIDIKVDSFIAVSFNQPDSICLINQPVSIEYPTRIFVSSSDKKKNVIEFADKIRALINEVNLEHSESIVIYTNQLSADINLDRDIVSTIDILIKIIGHNESKNKTIKNVNDLPDNLRDLHTLFDKYAISDDQERGELIESLTSREIKSLIDKVDKRTGEINEFLDSFDDRPLTDNAQLLMSLTELVMELKNAPQQSV